MKCQKCGHLNFTGDKFCRSCGEPLSITGDMIVYKHCSKCGESHQRNSSYCVRCGNFLGKVGG